MASGAGYYPYHLDDGPYASAASGLTRFEAALLPSETTASFVVTWGDFLDPNYRYSSFTTPEQGVLQWRIAGGSNGEYAYGYNGAGTLYDTSGGYSVATDDAFASASITITTTDQSTGMSFRSGTANMMVGLPAGCGAYTVNAPGAGNDLALNAGRCFRVYVVRYAAPYDYLYSVVTRLYVITPSGTSPRATSSAPTLVRGRNWSASAGGMGNKALTVAMSPATSGDQGVYSTFVATAGTTVQHADYVKPSGAFIQSTDASFTTTPYRYDVTFAPAPDKGDFPSGPLDSGDCLNLVISLATPSGSTSRTSSFWWGPATRTVQLGPFTGSGGGSGGGGTAPAPPGSSFNRDAIGRPAFLTPGTSAVSLLTTKDAGHAYDAYSAGSASSTDASLLWDRATNRPRVLSAGPVTSGAAAISVGTATKDGEQGDFGAAVTETVMAGAYPVCAQHPDDPARVAALTLQGGALKAWVSYDSGAAGSWVLLSTVVASGLDFSTSGRAGLCWLGEYLCAVWADGTNLRSKVSADGGHTWPSGAVTVASAGPYSGVSCVAGLGTFYALAVTASAAKVFRSGDLGATWAATAADPAVVTAGTALGRMPESGRLLCGTTSKSDDDGASWAAP